MTRPTLLGLPYDGSSSYLRGAAEAPGVIREALSSPAGNGWSEDGREVLAVLEDAGDVGLEGVADPRAAIEEAVSAVARGGGRPLVLGGDHSVTYPVVRALRPLWPRLSILHLDAHPDLYPDYQGDRFSHACPFARILEEGLADQLVQVGIRTMNGVQSEQAERFGVEVIDMRRWAAGERPVLRHPVYVSVDVDAVDPAFAPGVSHREPGGLTPREVLDVLQRLDVPVVGADVVEFNPSRDPLGLTAPLCAKLVKELAARLLDGSADSGTSRSSGSWWQA